LSAKGGWVGVVTADADRWTIRSTNPGLKPRRSQEKRLVEQSDEIRDGIERDEKSTCQSHQIGLDLKKSSVAIETAGDFPPERCKPNWLSHSVRIVQHHPAVGHLSGQGTTEYGATGRTGGLRGGLHGRIFGHFASVVNP
jgi:hypothetical protein